MKYSFIIITFNRPDDCIECIQNILSLNSYDFNCELLIIDNNTNVLNDSLVKYIESIDHKFNVKYYKSQKNLGVAGGRNLGVSLSNGNFCIFIDDDAIFESNNLFNIIDEVFKDNSIGVIAVKSKNYYTKELNVKEFPSHNKKMIDEDSFNASFYIGVGHIIKKEVFDNCGLYPEDFFYGMEEYDLSYRIIDFGYKIVYDSRIIVLHKKSLNGRQSNKFILQKYSENKIKVALRNLPFKYLVSHWFLWSCKFLFSSKFYIKGFCKLQINIFKSINYTNREVVSNKTLKILKKDLNHNLFY